MKQYPRLVYKSASVHLLVKDDASHVEALDGGWFDSVPEAMIGKPVSPIEDNAPPTRQELEQKAKEIGLKFDGRTSDAKLGKTIAEHVVD